jgi:hypothetical protein
MVRMAVIVRPCFPITFPMSSFATRSSMMSVYSPSIPCTRTWSGLSTIAFAMCSTSSMMAVGSPPVVTPGSPPQPCAPAGHETTRLSGGSVAPPVPPGTSSGDTRTSAESRRKPTGQRRQAGRAGESLSWETCEACEAWRLYENTGRQARQSARDVLSRDAELPGRACASSLPAQAWQACTSQDGESHQVYMNISMVCIKFLYFDELKSWRRSHPGLARGWAARCTRNLA